VDQQQQQQQSVKGQSGILDQCPALFATALLPGHAVYVEYATRVRSRYSVSFIVQWRAACRKKILKQRSDSTTHQVAAAGFV